MTVTLTVEAFLADPQGARFRSVVEDPRLPFGDLLSFFNEPERQKRMEDSEIHHDRPALAGVVRELERTYWDFFSGYDGHTTLRHHQAIGVIVRLVMEGRGWHTTGVKDSLGQRARVPARTSAPGAYRNTSGLSDWFTKAERYSKPDVKPYARARRQRSGRGRRG